MLVDGLPVHFSFEGDPSEVEKWIPYAKRMFSTMPMKGKVVDNKTPVTGVEIHVSRLPSYYKIHIKAESGFMVNGLCSLHLTLRNGVWTYDDEKGIEYLIERTGTNYSLVKAEKKMRSSFNSKIESYSYNKDAALTGDRYPLEFNNSPFLKTPGMYSGEMRKVVQVLIGQGKPIPFEFNFNRTHGIWKASNGTPWVIEIGTRGILAEKLPIKQMLNTAEAKNAFINKWGATGYDLEYEVGDCNGVLPEDTEKLNDKIASGKVKRLRNPSELEDFYNANGYFSACGWAFSGSGSQIQNTAWLWENPSLPPSTTYIIGIRWKIQLINSSDKSPEIATLGEVERGYLHGDRVTHFKMPGESITEGMYSFDLSHGNLTGAPVHDTTFYVWYDGEIEKLCKYYSGRAISSSSINTISGGNLDLLVSSIEQSETGRRGTVTTYEVPECYIDNRHFGICESFSGDQRERQITSGGGPTAWLIDFPNAIMYPTRGWTETNYIPSSTYGQTGYTTITIPFGDRESAYIYTYDTTRWVDGTTGIKSRQSWAGGNSRQTVNREYFDTEHFLFINVVTTIPGDFCSLSNPNTYFDMDQYPCPAYDPLAGSPPTPHASWTGGTVPWGDTTGTVPSDLTSIDFSYLEYIGSNKPRSIINDTVPLDISNEWLDFLNGSKYEFYHAIPDAFTGNRLISKTNIGIGGDGYINLDVSTNYLPVYDDQNFYRFFFGVP